MHQSLCWDSRNNRSQKHSQGQLWNSPFILRASLIVQLVKNLLQCRRPRLIPLSGGSTGEGIGYLLQYSWASLVAQLVKKKKKKKTHPQWGRLHLIPGSGRSHGEGKGYPLQYSGLENSMDCISRTRLSNFHFHFFLLKIFKYSECHGKSNLV